MKKRITHETNILIYGHEIGGQMQLLAEKLRQRWINATAVAFNRDFRGYQNDVNVSGDSLFCRLRRLLFSIWAILHYDVFHFFWGVSLWSFWRFHLLDLPILKLLGKTVVVHFRGLDVVDIKYFDYKRAIALGDKIDRPLTSRPEQVRKIRKWKKYSDSILVSEPELHFVSSDSILCQQAIDPEYWQCNVSPKSEEDGIIRIVHAPSSRRKKGTDFIEKAIEELRQKGRKVELVLVEKLGHHKVKELYCMSHIGIDQVLYGWHGKVSVEMMAVGLPVICHIDEELRKYRPDLPIIDATPSNLVKQLETLIDNSGLRMEISKRSRDYARRYHDVEIVIDQLTDIYRLDAKSAKRDSLPDARMW
jgi:glycosyltransferase involved in cell wall biosynthesis